MRKRSIIPLLYILFLMLPIYWLGAMSFKTTGEILYVWLLAVSSDMDTR